MKTPHYIHMLRTTAILAALIALPQLASARSFSTMSFYYATTNVPAGVAAMITNTVTLVDGNGGSSVGNGSNCIYSVSVSPSDPSISASLSVTNFISQKNFPQTPTTVTIGLTTLTPSNTYLVTVWANINPSNASFITPISTSFTITMLLAPPPSPVMLWSPAGVDTNWSTAGNWTPNGPPTLTNDVFFYDLGGGAGLGTVDNVVNNNATIGSLTYGQTNHYHTTLIANGKSLTVVDTNGVSVGTGTDVGSGTVPGDTITGASGTLVVNNPNASVSVTQGSPSSSPSTSSVELDLSGLGAFNAVASRLLVGVDSVLKGDNGTLNLAKTNVITLTPGSTAPQLDVGESGQASAVTAGGQNILLLGQTNAFYVDSIAVGRGRVESATMLFNSAFSSPTAYFRGTNGNASRVGTWTIGDGLNGKVTGSHCNGTNDFSLGTVDALVDAMNIGVGSAAPSAVATSGTGTLNVNAGAINVNTLSLGITATNSGPGIGTVNLTGGALVVNTSLILANGTGSATLNVSNATLTANNGVIAYDGTNTLSLTASVLNATNTTATIGASNSPMSFVAVTNSTLNLAALADAPSIATTNLQIGAGPNTINVTAVPLMTILPSQFQVIQYGINGGNASGDPATFVLGSLPAASPTAYGGYLSNNVANNSIDLVITNGPVVPILTWDGTVNGNWDTTSANWKPASGPDTVYADLAFVTFDDSLHGTSSVNVTETVMPGSLTINNTLSNYMFTGAGKITGATGLLKSGSGSLVLDNGANDFSGGIVINAGTLQIGKNDANGGLPSGSVVDNGSLVFSRTNSSLVVDDVISGTGTLVQNGANNILTLAATNTDFSGPVTVLQGTLQPGNPKALGTNQSTGSITITNSATLDVNGQKFGAGAALPVIVSGAGVGGNGAIVNNASNQTSVFHIVKLTANTTFGGSGNWDIRTSGNGTTNQDAQLNGAFNLTKVDTNTVTLTGVQVDSGLENINIQAGALDVANMTTSLGDSAGTVTVFTNATLVLDTLSNVLSKTVVLNDGGALRGSSTNYNNGPVTFNGTVTLTGSDTISANGSSLFLLQNTVGGAGGFTKSGSGTLFLANADNYTGGTVISGGTLSLTNFNSIDGSISSTTNINITGGAVLDVSGRSNHTLTLASGQTLAGGVGTNGAGTLNGILIASAGAGVSPGTGTTNVGTLSVISNATLNGSTMMKISAAGGNDQLAAYGINFGGTLMVTNFSGLVTNGQTFRLFTATNNIYNSGSFAGVTLPSAPGLSWTNKVGTNGTIVASVVPVPPTPPITGGLNFISPTQLVMSGTSSTTNYLEGFTYSVLSSANVGQPLGSWTTNSTGNAFNPGGNFRITNSVNASIPQTFYILRIP